MKRKSKKRNLVVTTNRMISAWMTGEMTRADHVTRNAKKNAGKNVKRNAKQDVRKNAKQDVRKSVRLDVRQDVRKSVRRNVRKNARQGVRRNVRKNVKQDVKKSVRKEEVAIGKKFVNETVRHTPSAAMKMAIATVTNGRMTEIAHEDAKRKMTTVDVVGIEVTENGVPLVVEHHHPREAPTKQRNDIHAKTERCLAKEVKYFSPPLEQITKILFFNISFLNVILGRERIVFSIIKPPILYKNCI